MPKVSATTMDDVKRQLHTFHNPFAGTTNQPKIPDGKATHSLGFQTQTVDEIVNGAAIGTMHFIMYAGQNSGLVAWDPATAITGTRRYFIPNFNNSGGPNWSGVADATAGGNVVSTEAYAHWRMVSVGLQLKLLNTSEEDDGWWEAIRLTPELSEEDWLLTTAQNGTSLGTANDTMAPVGLLSGGTLTGRSLANEPSYTTGLLRDLNRVQFELHGTKDYHDFIQCATNRGLDGADLAAVANTPGSNYEASFNAGSDKAKDLINQYVDTSYDMMYIRLHCRQNQVASETENGSRLHVNLIANQEVIYDSLERESRYQTRSHNIGAGAASVHADARRKTGQAAHIIT